MNSGRLLKAIKWGVAVSWFLMNFTALVVTLRAYSKSGDPEVAMVIYYVVGALTFPAGIVTAMILSLFLSFFTTQ